MRFVDTIGRLSGDGPFTRRMLGLSATSFALLIAAGLAAMYMANRAAEAEGWIVHTMDARRGARTLLVELLKAETGTRGFVLAEDEKFLEPFNLAQASARAAIEELGKL